jgi:hypothetical protein
MIENTDDSCCVELIMIVLMAMIVGCVLAMIFIGNSMGVQW